MIRAAVALALLLGTGPARAAIELAGEGWQAEADAQLRLVGTFTREEEADRFLETGSTRRSDSGLLTTRLRLDANGAVGDRLFGQVTYDAEFRTGSGLRSLGFEAAEEIGTRTWLDADRTFSSNPDGHLRHALYRAWLRYEGDRIDVTLGRQRIALGRGRLWNPTDLFNPIFPLAIEGDQRIGQDAVVVRLRALPSLHLAGIWSPQDDPDDHRAAVRLEVHRREVDAALMVGSFAREWVFGADFAAGVKDAALRGEATLTDLRGHGRVWQVVGSVDRSFDIGTGLYVLVEHLYNENVIDGVILETTGSASPVPREVIVAAIAESQASALDRITTVVRHQTGVQIGYDVTPLLRADLLTLYDWHGPSAAIVPAIRYAWRSDVEVTVAAQLFVGQPPRTRSFTLPGPRSFVLQNPQSEYGGISPILILQLDGYF